ncbi:MAG: 50S ribosomal protein L23 [Sulfurovum sp.]|nr:50S ribosomal protein L23 [Sulfurovum sp.]MCB4744935.1 50S ribosomal protein L23 [Sulfurovum sp.]MCB4746062.1 50S ribosomal protein L23 [Sulfurovum sp.]MCB4748213.1 50S ribosomal protein L23 [Sulfurovum sp.]MCB4749650.1 50S ribosomal protein L23 [Sulfurovum sp.]
MADITDIKSIMYTEKSLALQEESILVVQTTPRMTKNSLKEVFKEFFGITPLRVNSMRVNGKVKRFKGIEGKRPDTKKFYVKLPEDAKIESLAV